MKKTRIFLALAFIAYLASSCKKLQEIKDQIFSPIDVNVPSFQFTVPAIPIVISGEASLGSISSRINLDSTIRANTGGVFGLSSVSSIKVKQMVINITNADAANNLANFESARVSLSSNTNTTQSEIATFSFPDTFSNSSTSAQTNNPDLISYFSGNELNYNLYGRARRITTKPLNFVVSVTLSVK